MVEVWDVTIPELTGDEPRRAYIYLPESYLHEPDRRYPVLYMFDGHNVFFDEDATYGKSWGMTEYMEFSETELIIAAVECNHHPDNGRLSEYSPFSFKDIHVGNITGRGRATMRWMIRSFKAYIDRNYRTLPDRKHTFIAGSSMGGLMSLYAVTAYNRYFSRAAALSPSLWTNPAGIEHMIRRADIRPGTVVYMDYGSEEMKNHIGMEKQFKKVSGMLLDRGIWLSTRIVPNGDHSEASWEKQIPFFMETLLYDL